MSVEAMAWVLNHSDATGTDKLILLGIANHTDSSGRDAWPSVKTLATYASVSERAARYALRRLEEDGRIVVEDQGGGNHRTDPRYRPNRYSIVMSTRGASDCPPDDLRGATQRVEGGNPARLGGQPVAAEPSLNRPEPSALSINCPNCNGTDWVAEGKLLLCTRCPTSIPRLKAAS